MKFVRKHLIVTMMAAMCLAAGAQIPSPAPGAGSAPVVTAHEGHGRFDPAKKHKRMAKRLGALKQKLQLNSAQENNWSSYVAALKPTHMQRPDRAEFARLTTPERIERMRAQRTARMAEMDRRADATKTFYAALSPEQKKVFDDETAWRGHRGKGGRHGHHHHKG